MDYKSFALRRKINTANTECVLRSLFFTTINNIIHLTSKKKQTHTHTNRKSISQWPRCLSVSHFCSSNFHRAYQKTEHFVAIYVHGVIRMNEREDLSSLIHTECKTYLLLLKIYKLILDSRNYYPDAEIQSTHTHTLTRLHSLALLRRRQTLNLTTALREWGS